ncbi:hypothetical protein D6789_01370 [Candidatus Woesearchaeota archaeon]|nr:MAG: hypothetical protein D6789_01370 [Candidatus Woesearchaeota archaeon]
MQLPGPGVLRTDPAHRWKDKYVTFFEIEHSGTFSLSDLYVFLHQWYTKEGYKHWKSGDNKVEDFYLHRISPEGIQENLFWWRTTKKINDYLNYFIKMDVQVYGAKKAEIMYQGKKVKANKAGVAIRVHFWVQVDPYNRWEKSFLGKWKERFYEYLTKNEVESHKDKLHALARRMENEIKQFFELTTTVPMQRSFFPEQGFKWQTPEINEEPVKHIERRGDGRVI